MKRFVHGQSRTQSTLLPEPLDEYRAEDSPVRVIDAFVDQLNLYKPGFEGVDPVAPGRPGCHRAALLKVYIYGHLNRVQSGRRRERETQPCVELMRLIERSSPDFTTIARFRKDNGQAIRGVCRQFVLLCRELGLVTETLVAIDASKFEAANNRDRNLTSAKLKRRMQDLEAGIERNCSDYGR